MRLSVFGHFYMVTLVQILLQLVENSHYIKL